ncbi:MAG: CDP-archaeol synthase, partial [Desulfobulbaceae bacterium]|nr:CDP-archaeol synthase [Candidatus Desulfobia pelagia]
MPVVAKIVIFLLWVNFVPALANLIWGDRFTTPVDGGLLWFDKRPIFGPNKTIRGIILSTLGATAIFPLLGPIWWLASIAALLAMAGDLLSSFIKRRFNLSSGRTVVVLDQIFESLFPALFLSLFLSLTVMQVAIILLCFMPVSFLGSFFWNYITYRPPQENYPRIIRSPVRFREWRSCHTPLARWQGMLNLTSFLSNQVCLTSFFKMTGLYEAGISNTLNVQVEEKTFYLPTLPDAFDHFRILLLTDLHLDGLENLTEILIEKLQAIDVDLCLIGGDIRMKTYGPIAPCLRHLRRLIPHI